MRERDRAGLGCGHLALASQLGVGAPLALLRRGLPFFVSLLTAACDTGPRTFADVEAGRVHLDAAEVEALRGWLASAGLRSRQLGIEGELASTSGSWIEIDAEGFVWALGLGAAPELDSLEPLARLRRLSRLRIRDASLDRLDGLCGATELRFLTIQNSGLRSLAGLDGCRGLRLLDLRGNALESMSDLAELPELRTLDLAANRIAAVRGLAGRETLESLDLSGNALTTAVGIDTLPHLERLNLARNRLASLDGLSALPRLRQLLVDGNRLTDASAVDALPALEIVNLNGNRLDTFPRSVRRWPQHLWQDNPGTRRYRESELEARRRREQQPRVAASLPQSPSLDTSWSRGLCSWRGSRPECDVRIPKVAGAGEVFLTRLDSDPLRRDPRRHPPRIRLRLEVAQGRVRAYLAATAAGYPYVESVPGEAAALVGDLFDSGRGVWFVLEAVDGVAENVRYRIEPELGS